MPRDHERRPVDLRLAARCSARRACTSTFAARSAARARAAARADGPARAASSTTTAPPTTRAWCSRTCSTPERWAPSAATTPRSVRCSSARRRPDHRRRRPRRSSTGAEERARAQGGVSPPAPWTDEMIRRFEVRGRPHCCAAPRASTWCSRERLPLERAITLISPVDGRVMFAIPWARPHRASAPPTPIFAGTADEVARRRADAEYLCESANGYFPSAKLTPDDVHRDVGRPAPADRRDERREASRRCRASTRCSTRNDGLVIIAGGKLTTYRRMAQGGGRAAVKWLREKDAAFAPPPSSASRAPSTGRCPAPGPRGPSQAGVAAIGKALVDEHGLDAETAGHLAGCTACGPRARRQRIAVDPTPRRAAQRRPALRVGRDRLRGRSRSGP